MRVPGVPFVEGRNDYTDRDGRKYGVAIHNTSNDAPASGEASYATRRTDGISAHFYVDGKDVIQSIDTKYRTGHAGSGEGNDNAVSVEITGTNSKSRQWWLDNVAWDKLAAVLAAVCKEYDIEPRRASVAEMRANPKVRAFYSHDDMRLAWGGTTHTDPGDNFPWDRLLTEVKQALSGKQEDDVSAADVWNAEWQGVDKPYKASSWLIMANTYAARSWQEAQAAKAEATKARLTAEATLAAVKGLDTKGVLARINEVAAAEAARDQAAAQRDADLAELVRAGQSGELTAEQVLAKLRDLLPADGATAQS